MSIQGHVLKNLKVACKEGAADLREEDLDLTFHTTRAGLRSWAKSLTDDVALIQINEVPPDIPDVPMITYSYGDEDETCCIMSFTWPIVIKGNDINNFLILAGGGNYSAALRNLPFSKDISVCVPQPNTFPAIPKAALQLGGSSAVIERTVFTVACKDDELTHYVANAKVDPEMGLLATIFNLYDYTRDWLMEHTTVISYAEAVNWLNLGDPNVSEGTAKQRHTAFITRSALFLLGPSYSQKERVANQVQKRGQAAAQSMSDVFPDQTEVNAAITTCGYVTKDRTGLMDDALARVLAIDKKGNFDINVTKADLMPLQHYIDTDTLSSWAIQLLDQARMVYANSHTKTLNMALKINPLVSNVAKGLGPSWTDESEKLDKLAVAVKNRPFTGLRSKLPEERQASQFTRHAYIGVLYHRATLVDDKKRADFEAYNIPAIRERIEDPADAIICETMLNAIPKTEILGLVAIVGSVSLPAARDTIDGKSKEVKGAVLKRLLTEGTECEWKDFYKQELIKMEMNRIKEQADKVISDVIEKKIKSLQNRADADPDQQSRARKRIQIMDLNDRLRQEAIGSSPLSSIITSPEDVTVQEEFTREITRLETLIRDIQDYTMDNLG